MYQRVVIVLATATVVALAAVFASAMAAPDRVVISGGAYVAAGEVAHGGGDLDGPVIVDDCVKVEERLAG